MGFLARNITSGPPVDVPINDIGITVRVGEDYNMSTLAPADIQNSVDLPAAITAGDIVILDPLDDITPMSVPDSLEAAASANDTHFRINGGMLDQLDDVDLTGGSPGDLLQFNIGGTAVPVPPETAVSDVVNFREPTITGLASGGEITSNAGSPTTDIDIEAGTGFVVDAYTDAVNPTKTDVSWSASIGLTVTQTNLVGFTSIMIDNTGIVVQVDGPPTEPQLRTLILLGFVYYDSGSISSLVVAPKVVNQTSNTFYDLVSFFGRGSTLANGLSVQKVDSPPALSIFRGEGEFFVPGADWFTDPLDPNIASFPAVGDSSTPAPFDVILADGTIVTPGATLIPQTWDDGTATPDPLAGNNAVIHYMLENAGGVRYLQLGQIEYNDFNKAAQGLFNDATNHIFFPNAADGGFRLLAQIVVNGDANDFEDSTKAAINNILGEGGIANGAGSQTDEKAKVTATDTVPDFLGNKIVAGGGIALNVINPAGNEQLEITTLSIITFNAVTFENPTSVEWPVNELATAIKDPNNNSLTVRSFDDTLPEGIGILLNIPFDVTTTTMQIRGRRRTGGVDTPDVALDLYSRRVPDGAAITAWAGPFTLTPITLPNEEFFVYATEIVDLATISVVPGEATQFELVRSGGTLAGDFLLVQVIVEFS